MMQTSQTKVLIVDDEEVLRKAMVFDFKRKGYQVFEAQSGRTALEILDNNEIDLIISDIRMPDGSGIDLLLKVKSKNVDKPVVLLMTGYADITLEDAYEMGADAIFNKPFDRKELLLAVEERLLPNSEKWRCANPEQLGAFDLNLNLESLSESIKAHLLNIGRGGFFAASQGAMPKVGTVIDFSISFKNENFKAISGKGTVRWARGYHTDELPSGYGVEFTTLSPESHMQLLNLMSGLRRKAFIPKS